MAPGAVTVYICMSRDASFPSDRSWTAIDPTVFWKKRKKKEILYKGALPRVIEQRDDKASHGTNMKWSSIASGVLLAGMVSACGHHHHDDKEWTKEELEELERKWGHEVRWTSTGERPRRAD